MAQVRYVPGVYFVAALTRMLLIGAQLLTFTRLPRGKFWSKWKHSILSTCSVLCVNLFCLVFDAVISWPVVISVSDLYFCQEVGTMREHKGRDAKKKKKKTRIVVQEASYEEKKK